MNKENDFTLQELELIATQMPLISKNSDLMQKINAKIKNMTPKTIRIGEFDVPAPLCEAPIRIGEVFAVPYLTGELRYAELSWTGDERDILMLKRRIIHTTPDAAILHANALLSFTEIK